MNIEQARFNMIEQQIRPANVSDPAVLDLCFAVKRECFVPENLQDLAFADIEIPLGLQTNETMLCPKIEARLLQDLQLRPTDKVLQIGAGSGHTTALLATQSAYVSAYEIHPALAERANQNLQSAGIDNAKVFAADAAQALPEDAQFDVIVLCGSVAFVEQYLLEKHLLAQGRLWAVVGNAPVMEAMLFQKSTNGMLVQSLWETVLPRLYGFAERPQFHF